MPLYQTVLFSAAMAVVFTQGEIFRFLRRGPWLWRELAKCALCSGVWLGAGMYCLFYGFPHGGGDLWTIASSLARVLGIGALSGCVAVLFVAVWEKLDERAPSVVFNAARIDHATMPIASSPTISASKVKIVPAGTFDDEAPTDPSSSDSRLTKKVSTERLPIAQSRRSNPENE